MKKLALYINTLRYLKWVQIRYQLIHRVRQAFFSFNSYKKFTGYTLYPVLHKYPPCVVKDGLYSTGNHFCFLNLKWEFGEEIDWNYSGYGKLWQYNLQYFDYLNDERVADDVKIQLLNSFSAAIIAGHVKAEPFPVSIRLVNWILFYSRTGYKGEIFLSVLKIQVGYLEKNIEYHLQANHLLENYFSLAISGFCLDNDEMIEKYLTLVEWELIEQVLADGGHFEGSPMYHSLLLAKLFLLIDIIESNTHQTERLPALRAKAAAMTGWLRTVCDENAGYPFLNDAAPGIAVEPKILFERAKQMGIADRSHALSASGYRVFKNADLFLLTDIANIIPAYQPGHAHSDMLHFILHHKGMPVFVDAGTATYSNSPRREYERSTPAHNTVVINDTNQSEVWSSFRVAKRAAVTIVEENENMIRASHDGYVNEYGITHSRSFHLTETDLLIRDELSGSEKKNVKAVAIFHLHPSVSVLSTDAGLVQLSNGMKLLFEHAGKVSTGSYQYADGFNGLIDAGEIRVQFSTVLQTKISVF